MALCDVPGPPLRERKRGDLVEAWWRADQLDGIARDSTGNVWAQVRTGPSVRAIAVCAHLDTVFEECEPHGARREGTRLVGPSVGDDSVALASLATLDAILPATTRHPVWLLATIGEEGLGDLAGVRAALASPPVELGALIAVEGNYLGRICTVGVGSSRWRVEIGAPGGHAWEAADVPSAVHVAASMIDQIARIDRPLGARSAVNVGTVQGGEAINGRARHAEFEVDLRSDDPDALQQLIAAGERVMSRRQGGCEVTISPIGQRPAGRISHEHPLTRAAIAAHQDLGVATRFTAASTDANAAHAVGIPALALGVTYGSNEHTPEEWIDLSALEDGLHVLARTVAAFDAAWVTEEDS